MYFIVFFSTIKITKIILIYELFSCKHNLKKNKYAYI